MSSSNSRVLAIDGGKTKTAVAIFHNGTKEQASAGPGLEIVGSPGGRDAVKNALERAVGELTDTSGITTVCIGLNGVRGPSKEAATVAGILREIVPAEEIIVTSDVITNYYGALGEHPGGVIAAGTGAIAVALGDTGDVATTDGWGYLIGDDGSGYEIGRKGLRSVLRYNEGRGGSRKLAELAHARWGSYLTLSDVIHSSEVPAQLIATFAKSVADAAREGDQHALQIWDEAGQELALSVVAALARVEITMGPRYVSWTGGLFSAGDLLIGPFSTNVRELAPDIEIVPPLSDVLDGARLLAESSRSPFADHIYRDRQTVTSS